MPSYRLSRNPMYAGEAVVPARLGTLLRRVPPSGRAGDRLRRWDTDVRWEERRLLERSATNTRLTWRHRRAGWARREHEARCMSEENTRVLAALLNLEPTGGLEPPAFSLPRKCSVDRDC